MPPIAVGLQERADQQHRGAGRPDEGGEQAAHAEERRVRQRSGHEVPTQQDPPRDDIEPRQQDDEGHVFREHVPEDRRIMGQVEHQDGRAEDQGNDELVAIALPPAWNPQRTDGDGKQHRHERKHAIDGRRDSDNGSFERRLRRRNRIHGGPEMAPDPANARSSGGGRQMVYSCRLSNGARGSWRERAA